MAFERVIIVKNLQGTSDTYAGQSIAASGEYTIQSEAERQSFAQHAKVNQHLWSDPAKIAINNGQVDLSVDEGDAWLKLIDLSPKDAENSPIVKAKVVSQANYIFQRKSMFFVGATSGQSIFEEDYLGVSQGDAELYCYDEYGSLVSGTSVSGAVETHFDFEPQFNYDLMGGDFKTLSVKNISGGDEHGPFDIRDYRFYVVVVPDLPKAYGGSVVLVNNLELPPVQETIKAEGRSVKNFTYDPVYHTNKVRAIVKHPKGFSVTIQMIFDIYYDRAEE